MVKEIPKAMKMKHSFEERLRRFKEAYRLYAQARLPMREHAYANKVLLLKGIELINEGMVADEKHAFRTNRDLVLILRMLLLEEPSLTPLQQDLIKKTLEHFRVYAIVKVQQMRR